MLKTCSFFDTSFHMIVIKKRAIMFMEMRREQTGVKIHRQDKRKKVENTEGVLMCKIQM
jgi:hypothetical protein